MFSEIVPHDTDVIVGNGKSVKAVGISTIKMNLNLPDGEQTLCLLQEVLYVPELAFNLISLSKITQSGLTVVFSNEECRIENRSGDLKGIAKMRSHFHYGASLWWNLHIVVVSRLKYH